MSKCYLVSWNMTSTFLCEFHPSGWSKADSSCKTYISIHSMCRDVDLLYWLLITQCQSQADGERNCVLFFSLRFHNDTAVDHYISVPLTVGLMSRCCAFPLSFTSLSLSLRPSHSDMSPAVSFLLWNPFMNIFYTPVKLTVQQKQLQSNVLWNT